MQLRRGEAVYGAVFGCVVAYPTRIHSSIQLKKNLSSLPPMQLRRGEGDSGCAWLCIVLSGVFLVAVLGCVVCCLDIVSGSHAKS